MPEEEDFLSCPQPRSLSHVIWNFTQLPTKLFASTRLSLSESSSAVTANWSRPCALHRYTSTRGDSVSLQNALTGQKCVFEYGTVSCFTSFFFFFAAEFFKVEHPLKPSLQSDTVWPCQTKSRQHSLTRVQNIYWWWNITTFTLTDFIAFVDVSLKNHDVTSGTTVPIMYVSNKYNIDIWAVSRFRVSILQRPHLEANYVTTPREGCPNPKAPPNPAFFSLFLEDTLLLSFMVSHIPRFFAHPKKKKEWKKGHRVA